MYKVIRVGKEFSAQVKYLAINEGDSSCQIITPNKIDQQELQKIKEMIGAGIKNYHWTIYGDFTPEWEVRFVWPQIVADFKAHFPHVNGWLSRSRLNLLGQQLLIKVEGKVAYKSLTEPNLQSFLLERIKAYTGLELELKLTNGNFLEELDESPVMLREELAEKKKLQLAVSPRKVEKNRVENPDIILGKEIKEAVTHQLNQIESELDSVIVQGRIFDLEKLRSKKGNHFFVFALTDDSNSITGKVFPGNKRRALKGELQEGQSVLIKGYVQYDSYSKELILMPQDINQFQAESKKDQAEKKRIELHLHSRMSAMDSVLDVKKAIARAAEWGHPALAITDHGVVQAFPDAEQAGKEYGVKIIYGMEAYLVDDGEPIIINAGEGELTDYAYTVFDLETTGLKGNRDEIIEVGAVKIKDGQLIDQFSTFVRPTGKIPAKITEITGIRDDMVATAPAIKKVLGEFLEFVGDSILVAHNASFDHSFLQAALRKTGHKKRDYPLCDTLNLSRALFPQLKNHKLNTLCQHLGIKLENHHRAVDDAQATAGIFIKMLAHLREQGINRFKDVNALTTKIDWKNLPLHHLLLLAKNKTGLKVLYQLVSSSHLEYFYRKPRVLKSQLLQQREHLLFGSACEAGQLFRSIIEHKPENEIIKIAKFYDFLEIQPLGNNQFLVEKGVVESVEELKKINRYIDQLGQKLKKPVVATGDVHFLDPGDQIYRKILQAGQGYDQAEEQAPLYFRTTDEMLQEFSYLGEERAEDVVINNPGKISGMIEELKPLPEGLFTPKIEGAEEQIREMSYQQAERLYGQKLPELVVKRLERELSSIINNGFSVIYLIAHKLVKKSLDDGYLVGSRGSVGSSLVATMCGITEVNPLPPHYRCPKCNQSEFILDGSVGVGSDLPAKNCPHCAEAYLKDGYDIPFEVFMGFEGDKVPDIDLNFSGEYQSEIHRYTEELFGRDYVFRAGTISTIANRTAFGFVKGYISDNDLNINKAEINRLVKGCTGVKRTTGQHPGGLMVIPRHLDVHDFTPIQHPANDQRTKVRTTHFDYNSISGRILKLDLLGHDDPTSLRMLQDITGIVPAEIPLDDPATMAIFSSTTTLGVTPEEVGTTIGTLGIPEFGTSFVRQMLVETKPTTLAELVRISGLSHGTDVWLNNAQELIREGKAKLAEVISVRDDIINYLIQHGIEPARAFWIMENVRKGKGLTDEEQSYLRGNNIPEWFIDSCIKIKYMFPKAHAAAYVIMAFRIAYFKVHHPEAFYATYFTTKAADFDARLICQGYDQISRTRHELEAKGNELTAKEKNVLTILEIVMEALARGIKFTIVDLYRSAVDKFQITEEGLLPPLISLEGLGNSAAASIAATREEVPFSSIEDLVNRTRVSKTVVEIMQNHGTLAGLPEKNQLSLFEC